MASSARSLRLCLHTVGRQVPAAYNLPQRIYTARRTVSTLPLQWRPALTADGKRKKKDPIEFDMEVLAEEFRALDDTPEPQKQQRGRGRRSGRSSRNEEEEEEEVVVEEENDGRQYNFLQILDDMAPDVTQTKQELRKIQRGFWNEDEMDPDLLEDDSETFEEDDIMSMAHGKLEEFREYREYARVAAWQMPMLSKLAQPFEPPTQQEPLRFRYTSYMGEFHPAESKVVVEFSPRDMPLNEAQQLKLKKLLGPRYNPETEIAKMSCEQFEHQAQNKRYLADLVNSLVAQAKDPKDMFEDVPLDTRHHHFKPKPKFPKEWRVTEERMKFIQDTREKSFLLDQKKEEDGTLINGTEKIDSHFNPPRAELRVPQYAQAQIGRGRPAQRFARS